ncbi:MAG: sensor histidine kinase [Vicinamibacterales bacterium]
MANTDDGRRGSEEYAQLLSLAAHEFRTPASVVGGYLRMLQGDTEAPLTPRQRKMVDEAARSCARLVALVGELSEVGKLDGGSLALASDAFDLFPLLEEVARNVHEGEDRKVRLHVTGAGPAPVTGDRGRLSAAFAAIFRAILREQSAQTTVVADRRTIRNNGSGSAIVVVAREGTVQRAYDASPSALDEKRGGIGLTLPIARRVIERHGGRVWSPVPESPDDRALKSAILVSIPLRE